MYPFANLKSSTRVFCFLDLEHPAVAWAVMRGMLVSASHASTPPDPAFVSFMQAGIIQNRNNARIFNEFVVENVRAKLFPTQVSRIQGMYFFKSRAEAEARIGDPLWPSYFSPENLLELELRYDGLFSDVDANWITFAPLANNRITPENLEWIRRYWSGEAFNNAPAWERIANGIALVLDETVRRKCYEYVREMFPLSHIEILKARLASEAGTRGGQISPFLLRQNETQLHLVYLTSEAEFQDPAVIESISKHPDAGALGRMMAESETWRRPDFRPWGAVVEMGAQLVSGVDAGLVPSLHHPGCRTA